MSLMERLTAQAQAAVNQAAAEQAQAAERRRLQSLSNHRMYNHEDAVREEFRNITYRRGGVRIQNVLREGELRMRRPDAYELARTQAAVSQANHAISNMSRARYSGDHNQFVNAQEDLIRSIDELEQIHRDERYILVSTKLQAIARGKAARTRVNTLYPSESRTGNTSGYLGPVYTLPRFTSGRIPNGRIQGGQSFPWVGNPSWDNEPTYPTHGYNTVDTTGYSEEDT